MSITFEVMVTLMHEDFLSASTHGVCSFYVRLYALVPHQCVQSVLSCWSQIKRKQGFSLSVDHNISKKKYSICIAWSLLIRINDYLIYVASSYYMSPNIELIFVYDVAFYAILYPPCSLSVSQTSLKSRIAWTRLSRMFPFDGRDTSLSCISLL